MKVLVHQPAPTPHVDEAVREIRRVLKQADRDGVELVCFPECYIGGYYPNDRGASAAASYELDSSFFRGLLHRIGSFDATLVVGATERRGDRLFNVALVIRHGRLLGRYAKAHPNEAFFEAGTEFPLFDVGLHEFGINICNDANFPEVAQAVANRGARIIVFPLNTMFRFTVAEEWRERHLENLTARARDTKRWVLSADITGETEDRRAYGCTSIVAPDGRLMARVPEGQVGSVTWDIPFRKRRGISTPDAIGAVAGIALLAIMIAIDAAIPGALLVLFMTVVRLLWQLAEPESPDP